MKTFEIIIGAIIIWIIEYIAGRILFKYHERHIAREVSMIFICSIVLSLINIQNIEMYNGIIKILCVYILQALFYKFTFNQSLSKSMVTALIWYLCTFVSEVIVVVLTGIFTNILGEPMQFMQHNLFINALIVGLSLCIVSSFKNKFIIFINNAHSTNGGYIVINIIILITLALLVFKIPFSMWKLDTEFIMIMTILLCLSIVGIYLLKQKTDIEKTTSMYQQVVKYSNMTNKLLEDYRMVSHEHKNQLSIIRQMIPKENIELMDYIDNLIDKRNGIKYKWVADLNHIPLDGLKGLINYKLLEMEDNHINSIVTISKDTNKIKLNKLSTNQQDHLYSIVGVYLDNAIQAAKESKQKEISLEIYKDKTDLVMILSNTYKGTIQLDKLDHYGYTTKGKNHGVGLHIVRTILNEDNLFSQSRKLIDVYYIQELRIHTDKLKTKK